MHKATLTTVFITAIFGIFILSCNKIKDKELDPTEFPYFKKKQCRNVNTCDEWVFDIDLGKKNKKGECYTTIGFCSIKIGWIPDKSVITHSIGSNNGNLLIEIPQNLLTQVQNGYLFVSNSANSMKNADITLPSNIWSIFNISPYIPQAGYYPIEYYNNKPFIRLQ